jgi:hypothetical protein
MTFEEKVARALRMDERARQRHCNPWSVYTRFTMIPLIGLAFWSRAWLHWWALLPISLVVLWVWINPRAFPPPVTTNNWASKVVLGEWVWMRRKTVAIPIHHRRLPNCLSLAAGFGMALFLVGVCTLHLWLTLIGGCISVLAKLWFADRMVALYEEMKDATSEYRTWLY